MPPATRCSWCTARAPKWASSWSTIRASRASPSPARHRGRHASLARRRRRWPRPVVVEMGGKNAAIVTATADLEAAADGVARSSFGFGGQKCSACSRVYVESAGRGSFPARLVARPNDPRSAIRCRRPGLGPIIRARRSRAIAGYVAGIARRGRDRRWRTVLDEGERRSRLLRLADGRLPAARRHPYSEEMFPPLRARGGRFPRRSDRARQRRSVRPDRRRLCQDPNEVERFLDELDAGVLYVNRRSGATTGAWPGINPFGGWKASGSTGKAGLSMYYVAQFMREQSHTVVD